MTWRSNGSRLLLLVRKLGFIFLCQINVIVSILFPVAASYSQSQLSHLTHNNYRAVFWTEEHGLSLPKKNVMLKDVNGFLWVISPVGLNRFDGSTFKVYHPDKKSTAKIGGSYTFSIVEDSLHNLWIGTNKGLSRYDIQADTFRNFLPDTMSVTSVATVMPFWATRNQVYCLEAGYKIVTFDTRSFSKKVLVTLDKSQLQRNNINTPNSIYDSVSNSVWMLTGEYNNSDGGLMQVSLTDRKKINYQWPCVHKNEKHSHYSYNIQYDKKRNCIWINTVDGLFSFSLDTKQFRPVPLCSDFMPLINYEIISGLELDLRGNLWLFTNKSGIVVYNPEEQTLMPLFSNAVLQEKISKDNMAIYADRDGMIWCGYLSGKGICQLIPFSRSAERIYFPGIQAPDKTFCPFTNIVQVDDDELWVGKADGDMYSYNPETGKQVQVPEENFPGMKSKDMVPLAVHRPLGKGWIGTWNPPALYEIDMKTHNSKPVPYKDISHKELSGLYLNQSTVRAYRNGFMFLVDRVGIFTVTGDSAVAQQVLPIPYHVTNIALAEEKRLFVRLHFSYTNLSFYEEQGRWIRTQTALDSIEWFSIYHDEEDKSYWVGAVKQVHHLDSNFKLVRSYTENDGLPGIDVLHIQKDDLGNIWMAGSQSGIMQINSKTGILTVLSEKDGYQKQRYLWLPAYFKDEAGNLYYAGTDGVDKVNPKKLDMFPTPTAYFQSLEVNQRPFPLSTGINNLAELSLQHYQTAITLHVGVIDYYAQGKTNIRYKLEGLNDNWQYAPGNYMLRFEQLQPGSYKLVIQASNSGNNFDGPQKLLTIHISPAFWNTWWFRALVAVGAIGLFYTLLRQRLQQKFRIQLERSEKERLLSDLKQRTTELEMQALRAQMNPHFIFNSLNSINRFIMQNDKTQASRYLTKFSRLVRLILQNSQASLITLESELESLELYLTLEALRFNHHFAYKISIAINVDAASLKVPPLILQPYVENAIWHGLMHKEDKGQLDIEVSRENHQLYFRITDNGVGRENAGVLASSSTANYKSMGLSITAHRIANLQHLSKADSGVTINDLVSSDGSAAGTEVIITMPAIHD
jgi:ligand-binding sensor domain-containing protein